MFYWNGNGRYIDFIETVSKTYTQLGTGMILFKPQGVFYMNTLEMVYSKKYFLT